MAEVKAATGGKGVDVILDVIGGAYIQRNYEAAALDGRIAQIAFQDGSKAQVDFMRLMLKRLTHTGATLRSRPLADKAAIARQLEEEGVAAAVVRHAAPPHGPDLRPCGCGGCPCPDGPQRPSRQDRAGGGVRGAGAGSAGSARACPSVNTGCALLRPQRGFRYGASTRLSAGRGGLPLRLFLAVLVLLAAAVTPLVPAAAVEAVAIRLNAKVTDLLPAIERIANETDRVQISTVPGADGIVRRIEVHASDGRPKADWMVFALSNNTDEQVDRLIVAPFYRMVGSGLFWPELGNRRILNLTPSQGFKPERQASPDADVFLVTLDPGSTVTFIAELATPTLPQLYLWEPDAYKDRVNAFTLYHGIVIGIAGLLALFLTILFVVKGSVMFPAAAALAWAVLGYIGLDFAFWAKVFGLSPVAEQFWRAAGEAILTATLLVFLFAYLNLNRWHVRYVHVAAAWLAFLAALVVVALLDAPVAAGIARVSLFMVAVLGLGVVIWLSQHSYDRAVLIIPAWLLLVVWVVMAGLTVEGLVTNDLVAPALSGGLVLIVMLIGFTVMQHAFAGLGAIQGSTSELERRALALAGSGYMVWDWDVDSDRIYTSPEAEEALGLKRRSLETEAAGWLEVLHPADRDRFRATLDGIIDQRRGRIDQDFRLRAIDGHYLTFNLRARPVVGADGEVVRCIGTLTDVTGERMAAERLLHDAVRDNLTGLPNRELFLDRLDQALTFARIDETLKPTVMFIDLDRFKQVNLSVGMAMADSILLTVARRMMRLMKPQDTLARISGDQFGLILLSERDPERITTFADTLRRSLRVPITFADREVFITASIGLVLSGPDLTRRAEVLKDAELAMYYAKRIGGDRIEVFRPAMRQQKIDHVSAGERPARGAGAGRDLRPLPAHRSPRGSRHRRLRGHLALEASPPRGDAGQRIHAAGGRERADPRSRPVRAGARGAPAWPVAAAGAGGPAAVHEHQRVIPPVAAPRPDPGSEGPCSPAMRWRPAR